MRHPKTLIGLVLGFVGVVLLVGIDAITSNLDLLAVSAVLVASVGYAIAPAMADRKMSDVPSSGVMSLSMLMVAVVYAVPGIQGFSHSHATVSGWLALAVLGLVCSALAFIAFFALIREIGAPRATLTTYLNTAIAIVLGVIFLNEPLTLGIIFGFPLVLIGSYFASRKHQD